MYRVVIVLGVFLASGVVRAEEGDNPHVWEPRVRSVAVFKNGYGFFMREGSVRLREGSCVGQHLPPAVFGTLAIYAHDESDVVDVVGSGSGEVVEFDGRDASKDGAVKRARLETSKNLRVQLGYDHKGTAHQAAGKLVSVGPEFVVLENQSGNQAVPFDGIRKMQILELPLRIHVERGGKQAGPEVKLGMAYLRKGITWIPEYTVRILDDAQAELTLRGTLVNEAEDLIHADVQLVVGVPHFLHANYLEPLCIGQVIRTIGAGVAPHEIQAQIMSRAALATNNFTAPQFGPGGPGVVDKPAGGPGKDLGAAVGTLPPLDAPGAASDYTVYTKRDLSLRTGEKAIVTIFRHKIPYHHLYRWNVPDKVTHSLVLQNNTDTAFTTGPFLAVSDQRPLSQDLLRYTPRKGQCEIPITAAINVATDQAETEADRKIKVLSRDEDKKRSLDLVTLQGELKLKNLEKRAIDVTVRAIVPGKPISVSEGGTLSSSSGKLVLTEREGTVGWQIKLAPGETRKLEYKYERYVPSP